MRPSRNLWAKLRQRWLGVLAAAALVAMVVTGSLWLLPPHGQSRAKQRAGDDSIPPASVIALESQRAANAGRIKALERQLTRLRAAPASRGRRPAAPALDEVLAFAPLRYPDGTWHPEGIAFEDCWIQTTDGLRIHAWHFRHPRPRAAVLYLHGNSGNLSLLSEQCDFLRRRLAISLLAFDYRGFGRSEGTPTIAEMLEDARAARSELARRENVAPCEIVLMGHSMGGAVAVELAARYGARGLVVQNSFTSWREVAARHYPSAIVALAVPDRLAPVNRISHYRGTVLISHGTADSVIPFRFGRQLFEAANEPKTFFAIPGGEHNQPPPPAYFALLDRLIRSLQKAPNTQRAESGR